jgi:integrase
MKKSTKTTDRNQAMEMAIAWERVETKAKSGQIAATHFRKVVSDVSEKLTGDSLIAPTVEVYTKEWLAGIKARCAPSTLERYENVIKLFLASLKDKAKQPITSVTVRDVELFLNSRMDAGVAPRTAIVDMKILNGVFRKAQRHDVIDHNPVAVVQLPKSVSSKREVFSNAEVEKLLAAAPSLEWQTLILLGYFVGARLGDCVHMKWENVDTDKGAIVYVQQKTGQEVTVPMHFNVIEHLKFLSAFGTRDFLCPKLANKKSSGKHGKASTGLSKMPALIP